MAWHQGLNLDRTTKDIGKPNLFSRPAEVRLHNNNSTKNKRQKERLRAKGEPLPARKRSPSGL